MITFMVCRAGKIEMVILHLVCVWLTHTKVVTITFPMCDSDRIQNSKPFYRHSWNWSIACGNIIHFHITNYVYFSRLLAAGLNWWPLSLLDQRTKQNVSWIKWTHTWHIGIKLSDIWWVVVTSAKGESQLNGVVFFRRWASFHQ